MSAPSATVRSVDKPAVLILLGAALLMIPPLLNGFPFIFPDSTDYLTIAPQLFRPPFYGLFITLFHWNRFIWAPVVMQCLVISHLLWLMVRLTSGRPCAHHFLPFMLGMTAFTSVGIFTGFLMADIFTPIMFLTFYILAFHARNLSGWLRYYLFLLACIATVTQIVNLPLGIGLCFVLFVLLTITRVPLRERLRALSHIMLPLLLSFIALVTINGLAFNMWTIAPVGQTFLMANMIEHGPVRHYLETSCPTKHYRICNYMPLPATSNELMWNENSVIWQLGGFIAVKQESAEIVRATFATYPDEVVDMLIDNFSEGLKVHAPTEEIYPRFIIQPFRELVRKKFGDATLRALDASAQSRDTIPRTAIMAIDKVVTPACFILLVIIFLATLKKRNEAFTLSVATLLFLLGNVAFCTALSGVFDRYQSRITWLMPMVLGLLCIAFVKKRRDRT